MLTREVCAAEIRDKAGFDTCRLAGHTNLFLHCWCVCGEGEGSIIVIL